MDKNSRTPSHCKTRYAAVPLAGCLLLSACSALPKGELTLDLGIKDRGVASWYGEEFHGKLAANGEVFDMTAYTAAHTFPKDGATGFGCRCSHRLRREPDSGIVSQRQPRERPLRAGE